MKTKRNNGNFQNLFITFDDVLFIYSRTISRIKSGFKQSKYFLPNGKPYRKKKQNQKILINKTKI